MSPLLVSRLSLRHNFVWSEKLASVPCHPATASSQTKAKVPISCKLSPAVAGAGTHGAERGVGTKCPARGEGKGGGGEAAAAMGGQKGNTGDGGDQAEVLDEGSGDVWPRPEEVSYATPSCEKVTPG
ncbi:hypothetical protein VZT92_013494 [Zoarces viviparus]|uniref:Uncharacterized protein n=1 Tax=Zoarces viviparus TaxID=48416 RepID=A0AAW1F3K8_ZOAVI